ncbi:MAG: hypothetical protein AAFP19_00930 [Bacteroidota bacterium]
MVKKENHSPNISMLQMADGRLVEAVELEVPAADILLEITSYPKRKKKNLLADLVRAKLHYEKARRRYRKAQKAYKATRTKPDEATQAGSDDSYLEQAKKLYDKRKAKLQKLQAAVQFYFGDRPQQLSL